MSASIIGFAGLVDGPLDAPGAKEPALAKARATGYLDTGAPTQETQHEGATTTPPSTERRPATGSSSATPDWSSRSSRDSQKHGDEFLMGFGKTARDGIHLQARTDYASRATSSSPTS